MICTWRLYFFWWPFLFWKKRTKNVERKNSIIENHCVIMKKIKQIKNFMVESKRIPFYKFHVSILFVCQFYIQCKGLIPSLIFLYEGHTSNWIFHNDINLNLLMHYASFYKIQNIFHYQPHRSRIYRHS